MSVSVKLVVLDGYTLHRGDLSWNELADVLNEGLIAGSA